MEAEILKSLNFEMGSPTVNTFLKRFAVIASENRKVKLTLLNYFLAMSKALNVFTNCCFLFCNFRLQI